MYVDYYCHTCAVHRIAKGVALLGQVFVFVLFLVLLMKKNQVLKVKQIQVSCKKTDSWIVIYNCFKNKTKKKLHGFLSYMRVYLA